MLKMSPAVFCLFLNNDTQVLFVNVKHLLQPEPDVVLRDGFPASHTGTGFATCSIKESAADSDADLDVDGDDTLEYGKAQYTEADIIPCSGAGEDQGEAREREALRGAVLKYDTAPTSTQRH